MASSFLFEQNKCTINNIFESCKKGRVELVSSHQLNNIFKKSMISRWLKYLSLVVLLFSAATALVIAKDRGTSKRLTTDQLINSLRSIKNPSLQQVESGEPAQDVKCGFGIRASVHNRWQDFTGFQKVEITNLLQVSSFEKDTVIGRFHIFYDISVDSVNTPALLASNNSRIPNTAKQYVDSVGRIFNDVYHIEVEQLGYDPPPFESGETSYRVFIVNMSDYGFTDWDPNISPLNPGNSAPRYPCFVHIHNDFSPFYTKGMNALKVTAAHEFHHVIQVGSYGFWANAVYAHELTSVWFEDVNYTDVNDYYQYLTDYFVGFSDGRSFNYDPYEGGYERCVWAHFIAKEFGINMMRKIWEEMRTKTYQENIDVFLESNDAVLTDSGMTLQTTFAEFTKWNYYTADRADTVNYYPEGNHYPRFQPLQKMTFYNTTSGNVEPLSSSMYEFDLQQDTITAIIANLDVSSAINRNTTQQWIDVTLSSGLQTKISAENLSLWSSFFIQSSTRTDVPRLQSNAAPNPFRLSEASLLKLPINQDAAKTAEVFFFTSSLQLVYSGFLSVNNEDGFRAIVVPTSEVKSKLSSGIYFILAKTANSNYKWKVAVIR
jgi:hypothetical protein